MMNEILAAISELSMGNALYLRACQLLPEPERTKKLTAKLRHSVAGRYYTDASETMNVMTPDQYTPMLEKQLQKCCQVGGRHDAEKIAKLLSRSLSVSENMKLLEGQMEGKEYDSARHSVMILLTRLEEKARQKSGEPPPSPNEVPE